IRQHNLDSRRPTMRHGNRLRTYWPNFRRDTLEIALSAGTDPASISLSGSVKGSALLQRAVRSGVKITADSAAELRDIATIAEELGRVTDVRLRVRPRLTTALSSDISHFPITATLDVYKPGIPWEDTVSAGSFAIEHPHLRLTGMAAHIGRQSAELSVWSDYAAQFAEMVVALRDAWDGWLPESLDIGGGLPISPDPFGQMMTSSADDPLPDRPPVEDYAQVICGSLRRVLSARGIETEPIKLEVEPGRSLYADCGAHITRVLNIKRRTETPDRTWVEVDTSVFFLPDTELENNRWPIHVADSESGEKEVVDVVGRSCTGDLLAFQATLPVVKPGELIVFGLTGAYQDAGASNFNALPRPATVLVNGSEAEVIKRAETLDDLLGRDRLPERFKPTVENGVNQ
ncbi:hypothetical protein, partial [Nocardia sp. NPDC047648]|uniref:diaminopimelate decarboxylase family protein n=1 Tax=Nocardia sp. NPDC047648 TaxID=3155625 RepID=UPI0033EC96B1